MSQRIANDLLIAPALQRQTIGFIMLRDLPVVDRIEKMFVYRDGLKGIKGIKLLNNFCIEFWRLRIAARSEERCK